MTIKPSLALFRLAKKATGLAPAEKHALIAIADACSMADGVCRKSLETLRQEWDFKKRVLLYGVTGRKRKDGTYCYPGLIARGIVKALRREGMPTVYTVDQDRLQSYSRLTSAQTTEDPCTTETEPVHTAEATRAQLNVDQCTGCTQVLKAVPKSVPKENSKAVPSPKPVTPLSFDSKAKPKSGGQEKPESAPVRQFTTDDMKTYGSYASFYKAQTRF